ncbi:hypothetical protein R3P38DRAFT_3211887 [Favolaschia claudopus]|uniref:Uncharacterized protein n=1 Tax=Favolaschia claudopus TaxID=2862362 RepID=A0AAW0AEX8_9AGAR
MWYSPRVDEDVAAVHARLASSASSTSSSVQALPRIYIRVIQSLFAPNKRTPETSPRDDLDDPAMISQYIAEILKYSNQFELTAMLNLDRRHGRDATPLTDPPRARIFCPGRRLDHYSFHALPHSCPTRTPALPVLHPLHRPRSLLPLFFCATLPIPPFARYAHIHLLIVNCHSLYARAGFFSRPRCSVPQSRACMQQVRMRISRVLLAGTCSAPVYFVISCLWSTLNISQRRTFFLASLKKSNFFKWSTVELASSPWRVERLKGIVVEAAAGWVGSNRKKDLGGQRSID